MACRIIRNTNNEIVTVYTENGQESKLYNELSTSGLNRLGATINPKQIKEKALELYATKDTQLFKDWLSTVENVQRDSNNEVDSKHLYDYAAYMAGEQSLDAISTEMDNSILKSLSDMLNVEDEFIQNNRPVLVEYLNNQLPGVEFTIKENGNITVLNSEALSSTYDAATVQEVFDRIPAIIENLQSVETKLTQLGNRLGIEVNYQDQVQYTKKDGTKATVKSTANSYLGLINISKGADIRNLTEEMAHIVVDSLEAANNPLFYSMYILSWRIFNKKEQVIKITSIIAILGIVNIPIIKFSVDWWSTLHQPASVNLLKDTTIHSSMLLPLAIMTAAFALFSLLIFLMKYNTELIKIKNKGLDRL